MERCADNLCARRLTCGHYMTKTAIIDNELTHSPRQGNVCPTFETATIWPARLLLPAEHAEARAEETRQRMPKPYASEGVAEQVSGVTGSEQTDESR